MLMENSNLCMYKNEKYKYSKLVIYYLLEQWNEPMDSPIYVCVYNRTTGQQYLKDSLLLQSTLYNAGSWKQIYSANNNELPASLGRSIQDICCRRRSAFSHVVYG